MTTTSIIIITNLLKYLGNFLQVWVFSLNSVQIDEERREAIRCLSAAICKYTSKNSAQPHTYSEDRLGRASKVSAGSRCSSRKDKGCDQLIYNLNFWRFLPDAFL